MIIVIITTTIKINILYIYIEKDFMIPHIPLKYIKQYYIILHPYNNPSVTH